MFDLYGTHIETIIDIHNLAKKHGYNFSLTVNDHYKHIEDFEITDAMVDYDDDLDFIKEKDLMTEGHGTEHEIILRFNKGSSEINALGYSIYSGYVEFDKSEYEGLETDYELYGEYSDNTIYYDFTKTNVWGFESVEYKPNVYRKGIMIREFYIMVCEMLGETPNNRTY